MCSGDLCSTQGKLHGLADWILSGTRIILTKYMMKACMVSIFVVLRRFALESMNSAISRSLSTSDCLGISENDASASLVKLTAAENIAANRMA